MVPSIDWAGGLLLLRSSKEDPCIAIASTTSADPAILSKYADYADFFNKEAADALPAHQE